MFKKKPKKRKEKTVEELNRIKKFYVVMQWFLKSLTLHTISVSPIYDWP